MISNPNSNDYDTCSSSSKFKDDGWGCEEGKYYILFYIFQQFI